MSQCRKIARNRQGLQAMVAEDEQHEDKGIFTFEYYIFLFQTPIINRYVCLIESSY